MGFTVKNWEDSPAVTTPLSQAAIEDLETRVTDYTDLQAGLTYGVPSPTGNSATDTANIQAEIDACSAAGGGIVRLQAGTYAITTVDLASDVTIWGPGAILAQAAGQTLPILYFAQTANDPIEDADLLTNVTIRDVTFTGDLTAGAEAVRCGIWIGQGTDIRVENCTFTNCMSSAVCCQNCLRVWYINNYVKDCAQAVSGRNALDFDANSGFSDFADRYAVFVASGNTVLDPVTAGIAAVIAGGGDCSMRSTITDNYVEGAGWVGYVCEAPYAMDNVIADNKAVDCNIGIEIADTNPIFGAVVVAQRNVISGNNIKWETDTTTNATGIQSESSYCTVAGNTVVVPGLCLNLQRNATTTVPVAGVSVTGNSLTNTNTNAGISPNLLLLQKGNYVTISGNTLVATGLKSYFGIYVIDSDVVNVTGNVVHHVGQNGIQVEDSDDVLVADNLVTDPGTNQEFASAIKVAGTTCTDVTIRGNNVRKLSADGNLYYGIGTGVTTATRCLLENNKIAAASGSAVETIAKFVGHRDNWADDGAAYLD